METTTTAAVAVPETKRTSRREIRQIAKCGRCKAARSRLVIRQTELVRGRDRFNEMGSWKVSRVSYFTLDGAFLSGLPGDHFFRCCNNDRYFGDVAGRVSDKHLCGAKCLASKGPSCECSCGGKNHGKEYEAAAIDLSWVRIVPVAADAQVSR